MRTASNWQFAPSTAPSQWHKTKFLARFLLILVIIAGLISLAAPLARIYLITPGLISFRVMTYGIAAELLVASLCILLLIFCLIAKVPDVTAKLTTGIVLGILPVLAVVVVIGPERINSPMIHDISTDTENPPQFREAYTLRTVAHNSLDYAGESLAAIQRQAYPDIKPIITDLSRFDALQEATQVVKDLRWEFVNVDYEEGIIEAYDTSQLFGFVDDIVIRVQNQGPGSRIDIRSVSRLGNADLGANALRIRHFINIFRG
jgi:uncharacterized protein (DUF1499 family)